MDIVSADANPDRVLVTGGGSGIGLAVVKLLMSKGIQTIAVGRSPARLAAAKALGATVFEHDICTDPAQLFHRVGPVNGLVLNAGVQIRNDVRNWDRDEWQTLLSTNLIAAAMLTQSFVKAQTGPASIVGVSSTLARVPAPCTGAYAASKAGLIAMLETVALEEAPRQIRANSVLPGLVDTEMTNPGRSWDAHTKTQLDGLHPLGRIGTPEEVAEVIVDVLFKKWMTGAKISIDGGLMLGQALL